jgi:hypothetical protein
MLIDEPFHFSRSARGGHPRCRRKAFNTTNNELNDIPMAAPQGGIQPAAANGTAIRL